MGKKQDLMQMALAATEANIVKSRGGSGKTTYLDRFVNQLLEDDGVTPTAPKTRLEVIAGITLEICTEKTEGRETPFTLTPGRDTEDDEMFASTNVKVKHQVAAAIARNNNSTSVSYNEKYKDKWYVAKEGNKIWLAPANEYKPSEA